MRSRLAVLLFALVATAGAAGQDRQAERPAGQLLVDAVAFDRQGMPVTDLRREEIEVWLRGFRLPFEAFISVSSSDRERGRMIVLILDDVMLPPQLAPRGREAALRFVNRLSPGDRMAVVTLSGRSVESTDDRQRLLRIINDYNAITATGPWRIDTIGEHVLKTVTALARQIAEAPYGRKVIVGIGTGWMFDTPIPAAIVGGDLRPEWTDAMRAMAAANASLYVIEPGGVGVAPFAGTGSSGFARETGGHAFMNTNDLTGAADRIMREAANYYLISVADPPIQRNAPLRDLEVKSLREGVTVRARRAIQGRR